ncbi:MAG: hypothetical protein JWM28_812 [Chitinophagaceae bacterium]|nr:hypothetical protein [Chitinophagaceae bacterium]
MNSKQNKTGAIEITSFKLRGCTCGEFIRANADIDAWLKHQQGFQSRQIAEKEEGAMLDLLHWDSVEDGTRAMHRIMDEMADSAVHGMIDQRTVSWNIYPVRHSIT